MKTEVDVPNPTLILVPGMYAEWILSPTSARTSFRYRSKQWMALGSSARIFKVQSSGAIQIVPAPVLGIETARQIEIRSGDVHEGDEVAVGSRSGRKDGNKVQPKVIHLSGDSAPRS